MIPDIGGNVYNRKEISLTRTANLNHRGTDYPFNPGSVNPYI